MARGKKLPSGADPVSVFEHCQTSLYSESTLIPFCETPASVALMGWLESWSRSQPVCLLVGATASGKTRLVQHTLVMRRIHAIETDCATASSVRDLLQTAESTQSHSVGSFNDGDGLDFSDARSVVVFEHIDALVTRSHPMSRQGKFASLLSDSRVPILMTANWECIPRSQTVHIIRVERSADPKSLLSGALWFRGAAHAADGVVRLESLLMFTGNDVRRASLQFQLNCGDEHVVERDEHLFLSIPEFAKERDYDRESYALLCDLATVVSHDNPVFDEYMRPVHERVFSSERENIVDDYCQTACEKMKMMRSGRTRDAEMVTSLVVTACRNAVLVTRNRKAPPFSGANTFTCNDVEDILTWKWWPQADIDLPKHCKCDM